MLLKLNKIVVSYGSFQAIREISLEVKEGEIVCVLGSNGAGKTTLVRTICGVKRIDSGDLEFNGETIDRLPPQKIIEKGITVSPQGGECFPKMTVGKNLLLGAFTCKDSGIIQKNYLKVVKLFPILEQRRNQMASLLSGGERQMLAIGRALMGNPKLLMLDEPSMGLAPLIVTEIFNVLKKINEEGTTILLVEQNANISLRASDKGYVIELGKIAISGSAEELLKNEEVRKAYVSL